MTHRCWGLVAFLALHTSNRQTYSCFSDKQPPSSEISHANLEFQSLWPSLSLSLSVLSGPHRRNHQFLTDKTQLQVKICGNIDSPQSLVLEESLGVLGIDEGPSLGDEAADLCPVSAAIDLFFFVLQGVCGSPSERDEAKFFPFFPLLGAGDFGDVLLPDNLITTCH